jgi:hypothetical protein
MTRVLETRRAILLVAGTTALFAASVSAELVLQRRDDSSPAERACAERLRRALEPGDPLRVFGRAFLGVAASRSSVGEIVRELWSADDRLHDEAATSTRLLTMLAELVEADFAAGRLANVSGWLLSRTEALLCALAVLVDPP